MTKKAAFYIKEVLCLGMPSLVPAWRCHGMTGVYMVVATWFIRFVPRAVRLPEVGVLSNRYEFSNYIGNFCMGELRNKIVEKCVSMMVSPLIVDVGVNIGITSRWWLSKFPQSKVIGVDMMSEAIEFTAGSIGSGSRERWQGVVAAAGEAISTITLKFDDPLDGTLSSKRDTGAMTRVVQVRKIDDIIREYNTASQEIGLLKIDVEGAAVAVLNGANQALAQALAVVFEGHNDEEVVNSARILFDAGFDLVSSHGRNYWWIRRGRLASIA